MAPFMISVFSRNAPLVTTRWPGFRPQATSTTSPRSVGLVDDPLRAVDCPSSCGEEDEVDVVLALDGRLGDDHRLVLAADLDLGLAELVGAEPAVGVGQLGPDAGGAGRAR